MMDAVSGSYHSLLRLFIFNGECFQQKLCTQMDMKQEVGPCGAGREMCPLW